MKAPFNDLKSGLVDYLKKTPGSTISVMELVYSFDANPAKVTKYLESLVKSSVLEKDCGPSGRSKSYRYYLPGSNVSAAKDSGSPKQDKSRLSKLAELVASAESLKEELDLSAFPEAKAACDAVLSVKDLSQKITEAQIKLKASPAGSEEADQAQVAIDAMRDGLDTMIPPLEATLETMSTLLLAAVALDEQFSDLSDQVSLMEEKLKTDKARIASISKAVEQSVKTSEG